MIRYTLDIDSDLLRLRAPRRFGKLDVGRLRSDGDGAQDEL